MIGALLKKERLAQNMSQETLCHGICAPSYLSKIETGAAMGTEDMLLELFRALQVTYVTDATALQALDALYKKTLEILRQSMELADATPEEMALCAQLRFSPRGVDACLLGALYDADQRVALQFSIDQLTPEQNLLYSLIKALHLTSIDENMQAAKLLQTVKTANEGWVYPLLAEIYFVQGIYPSATVEAEQGYQVCATQGNINGMLVCAMLAGSCYANVHSLDRMHHWYTIARNINLALKNPGLDYSLDYNVGATLLMYGKEKEALAYLLRAEAATAHSSKDSDRLYQKMIFALLRVGQVQEAAQRMPLINDKDSPMVTLLSYMLDHPDHLHEKEYCTRLEACVVHAKEHYFRGMMDFYRSFLVEAYIATKQYKKAVQYTDEFKLSSDTPFFD